MGVNDAREQLEVAKAEVSRLERALAEQTALRGAFQDELARVRRSRRVYAGLTDDEIEQGLTDMGRCHRCGSQSHGPDDHDSYQDTRG